VPEHVSAPDQWEAPASRRHFLRKLGTTLAIGLGVALIPAGRASAAGSHCCRSSCTSCGGGTNAYTCHDNCSNKDCCICFGSSQTCIDIQCICG
jgi:hypothetical protein